MENFLQSIVKIIIIGNLCENANVRGNRQFLPPLIPYFQNGNFIAPSFPLPPREPIPIYYQDEEAPPPPPPPPPISYQNVNSYPPPRLFHQNENYNPLLAANPGRLYPPQILPYKPSFYPPHIPTQKISHRVSQGNHRKQVPGGLHERPGEIFPKKPAFYATNIIVKEESKPSYYQDDYNKNYHEEDYSDNYSDDISSPPEPCLNSPYRYFEPAKPKSKSLNLLTKYKCTPYFQPAFGKGVYTLKMPITLLPSRFPPRVEELLERIQNYFSTYTQQETPNPLNLTTTATTVLPVTQAASESVPPPTATVEASNNKKNLTVEIEELQLEPTNVGLPETNVGAANALEKVTQKTIVVEIEKVETEKGAGSTPDAQAKKESQMAVQNAINPKGTTGNPAAADRQKESQPVSTGHPSQMNPQWQNQFVQGWNPGPGLQFTNPATQTVGLESSSIPNQPAGITNNTIETNTTQPTINVTDNKV